jgi:hypothetical protein
VQSLPVLRELTVANSDGTRQICWLFGDAGPAQQIEIAYNCLLENAPESQDGAVLAGTKAAMSWRESAVGNSATLCFKYQIPYQDSSLNKSHFKT